MQNAKCKSANPPQVVDNFAFCISMIPLSTIYTLLRKHFGALHGPEATRPWWPIFSADPPFEILVGAVLVQQTRWETVEAALLRLLDAGLLEPPALAASDPAILAALIRPAAFHTQKAPGLIAIARRICERYAGSTALMLAQPTPALRAELLALPRIGPESCDVIMLYGGGHAVFVVDEYTRRLFERVGAEGRTTNGGTTNGAKAAKATNAKIRRREAELSFWRRGSYEQLRLAIEEELSSAQIAPVSLSPGLPVSPVQLYTDFHAQINEVCVRYCLARPRCDGPPARRVYSLQEGRESYLGSETGCPLRAVCAHYQAQSAPPA